MQKPQVWMNPTAFKEELEGRRPRPSLLGPTGKHASNPETKKGFDTALQFYKADVPSVQQPTTTVAPTRPTKQPTTQPKEFVIDMTKFIPYDESPGPKRRVASLDTGVTQKEEWGWTDFLPGKKKKEGKEAGKEQAMPAVEEKKEPVINTEGVAEILHELKETKEMEAEKEEEEKHEPSEQIDELPTSGTPVEIPELTDEQFLLVVQTRMLRMKLLETEAAELKKRLRESELTAEQLVIKLGKEKEQVENLKLANRNLEDHNKKLVATLLDLQQKLHKLEAQSATVPATRSPTVKNTPARLW